MNEKILDEASQILLDSIKSVKSTTGQAIDFAKGQIPDVVEQLIKYNIAHSIFMILMCIVIGLVLLQLTRRYAKTTDNAIILITWPGAFITFCLFCVELDTLIQLIIAPKVWLLEYAAKLLKHVS